MSGELFISCVTLILRILCFQGLEYGPSKSLALNSILSTWNDYQMLNCTKNLIECKFFFICKSTFCVGFELLTIRDLSELILRERLN